MIGILRGIEYLEKQGINHCEYSNSNVYLKKSVHLQPEDVQIGRFVIHNNTAEASAVPLSSECSDACGSRNSTAEVADSIRLAGRIFLSLLMRDRKSAKGEDKVGVLCQTSFHQGFERKSTLFKEPSKHSSQLTNIAHRMINFEANNRPTFKNLIISLILQKNSLLKVKSLSRRARQDDSVGTAEFENSESEKRKSQLTIPTSPERKKPMSLVKHSNPMSLNHFKVLLKKKLNQLNEPSRIAVRESTQRDGTSCRSLKDMTRNASRVSQDGSTANRSSLKIFKKIELGKSNQSMLTMASCSQIKASQSRGPLAHNIPGDYKRSIPAGLSFIKIRRKKSESLNS